MVFYHFYPNFKRNFCIQTLENLIRCLISRRLIWFCTVCRCPTQRTLRHIWVNVHHGAFLIAISLVSKCLGAFLIAISLVSICLGAFLTAIFLVLVSICLGAFLTAIFLVYSCCCAFYTHSTIEFPTNHHTYIF